MPDFYSEPFLQLAGLTHKSALIAWGAFYFKVKNSGVTFKLVDDEDLKHIHPPRKDSIGARSTSYGPARVDVFDMNRKLVASASTTDANHCWIIGLQPDTEYTYRVIVNNEEWARDERRDWIVDGDRKGLRRVGNRYVNRFRTHPDPSLPAPAPVTFAVIGDFGSGVKKKDSLQHAVAVALKKAADEHNVRLILTTGDNIYASKKIFGLPVGGQGDEDDDWYFTFYQPYRYIINRVPVYPSIGNHDTDETEERDDRDQVIDNFYIAERIKGEEAAGRASSDPGLFYRFRYGSEIEFICMDTSREQALFGERLYKHPKHAEFLKLALPAAALEHSSPAWRIPFGHHPPFSAGPHHNTKGMEQLIGQFEKAGVRTVFSGHSHNFQHSLLNGVNYFVTGAAGKLETNPPNDFKKANTVSWSATAHFLLSTIDGRQMTLKAIGTKGGNKLTEIVRLNRNKVPVHTPLVVALD
jgi:tartrate-resistant acid phosphatase type 5